MILVVLGHCDCPVGYFISNHYRVLELQIRSFKANNSSQEVLISIIKTVAVFSSFPRTRFPSLKPSIWVILTFIITQNTFPTIHTYFHMGFLNVPAHFFRQFLSVCCCILPRTLAGSDFPGSHSHQGLTISKYFLCLRVCVFKAVFRMA